MRRKKLSPDTSPSKWPAYLGVADLMALFGRSRRTIERRLDAGDFGPWTTVGASRYVPRASLLRALGARAVDPKRIPRRVRRASR